MSSIHGTSFDMKFYSVNREGGRGRGGFFLSFKYRWVVFPESVAFDRTIVTEETKLVYSFH